MKRFLTSTLLLVLVAMTGCLKQDYTLCGLDGNCVLQFSMTGDLSGINFGDEVESVDLLIFTQENDFVDQLRVDGAQLASEGVALTLEPGDYRIMCWGNINDASVTMGFLDGDAAKLDEGYVEITSNNAGAPLYYGIPGDATRTKAATRGGGDVDYSIYDVEIPANAIIKQEMNFNSAHRAVHVVIRNIENLPDYDSSAPIDVEITNLAYKYDLLMRADETLLKNYSLAAEDDGRGFSTCINSARTSELKTNMILTVSSQTSNGYVEFYKDNLWQIFDDQDNITDINNMEIRLDYGDGTGSVDVTVTVPGWNENEIDPILPE